MEWIKNERELGNSHRQKEMLNNFKSHKRSDKALNCFRIFYFFSSVVDCGYTCAMEWLSTAGMLKLILFARLFRLFRSARIRFAVLYGLITPYEWFTWSSFPDRSCVCDFVKMIVCRFLSTHFPEFLISPAARAHDSIIHFPLER